MANDAAEREEQVFAALGIDRVCTQVYFAILNSPEEPITELAGRLSLSAPAVSDALDALADLALLRAAREAPGELRPVTLQRAVQILLKRQSDALLAQHSAVAALQSSFEQTLASLARPEPPTDYLDADKVIGLDEVQSRLESLMVHARREVATVLPGGPQSIEALEAARPLNETLGSRGLRLRSLYQSSMCTDRTNLEYARWCESIGVEVRCAPVVPNRMIIIDRETIALPLNPQVHRQGMLIVREPGVVVPLLETFESNWSQADQLTGDELSRPQDGRPTPQEMALLSLLATGATDESAAQRFNLSARTVSRMMSNLMKRLDASSRFEAGYKCAQNGWIASSTTTSE